MDLTVYKVIPAVIFNAGFLLFYLLIVSFMKYKRGKLFVALTLSGFFGFFTFFPLSLYIPFHKTYLFVPIFFFFQAILGFIGSLSLGINPFKPSDDLFEKKKEKIVETDEEKDETLPPSPQSIDESMNAINQSLGKLNAPFNFYKETILKFDGEKLNYDFIAIGPTGIYQIFPCNWGGDIFFSNSSAAREHYFEEDTKDYSIASTYRYQLLTQLLHYVGLEKFPIHTVICTTNPSSNVVKKPSNHHIIPVQELETFLLEEHGPPLSGSNISDFKSALENAIVQKDI